MNRSFFLFIMLIFAVLVTNCTYKAKPHAFPNHFDTDDKPIELQIKKTYEFADLGLKVDNQFDGARLNDFTKTNDSTFTAVIIPENLPINHSSYFGFRIVSESERSIELKLKYLEAKHRYWPKLSSNGLDWFPIDSSQFRLEEDGINAVINLNLLTDTLFVCAQELQTSAQALEWCTKMDLHEDVHFLSVGKSKLGRDLFFLDIGQLPSKKKNSIIVLSRQHPPEVSGYFAMQAFISEILADTPLSNHFRKRYRIMVYPMINPDGVDLGHWRHNAGGIDLNRDWSEYKQAETKQIVNHIVKEVEKNRSKVLVGIDFHSTQVDLYYTLDAPTVSKTNVPEFKNYWLQGIDETLKNYTPDDRPYAIGDPISKGWFYLQFGAEGITYEVGDETPREFVREKARTAAVEMMQLLIFAD